MSEVSIITPIYNSGKYLEQCLTSIVNQTLSDIEIILIDDGSTDSSPAICDEFAKQDERIKVFHNKNSGLGVSYNKGIDAATGEYIGFIESDDYVNENMYADLYSLAIIHDKPDIVKSAWFNVYDKSNAIYKDNQIAFLDNNKNIKVQENPQILTKQFTVWSAIYKRDFLINKNIRYNETPGASFQDVAFSIKAFTLSNSIVLTPDAYVYYRRDNETSSVNSKAKLEAIPYEYSTIDKFFEKHPDIKAWANESKLKKQYDDYVWNLNRIASYLKFDFIKQFASDFKKYRDRGELTPEFYAHVDADFLNNIMNLV